MQKLGLFIFSCLVLMLTSCRDFKEISVSDVDNFKINKINNEGIDAEIHLKIKNPNNVGFSIYPSSFDIEFSGIRLGKAKLNKRVHIAKNTEQVYVFKLKSDLKDLNLFDALQLLNTKKLGNIDVKGDLKAGKFYLKKRFPVNYTDKVNIFN